MWNRQFWKAAGNMAVYAMAFYLAPHLFGLGPDNWLETLQAAGVAGLAAVAASVIGAASPWGGKGNPLLVAPAGSPSGRRPRAQRHLATPGRVLADGQLPVDDDGAPSRLEP